VREERQAALQERAEEEQRLSALAANRHSDLGRVMRNTREEEQARVQRREIQCVPTRRLLCLPCLLCANGVPRGVRLAEVHACSLMLSEQAAPHACTSFAGVAMRLWRCGRGCWRGGRERDERCQLLVS
jgi:hypothetical protein